MKKKGQLIKLSDFASIELGYPLTQGMTFSDHTYVHKIYSSAVLPDELNTAAYCVEVPQKYFTQKGDIIIGQEHLHDVALIDEENTGLLISNKHIIVRCSEKIALPKYIIHHMMTDNGLANRKKICRDAVLPSQRAKKYADLKFRIPDLETQELCPTPKEKFEYIIEEIKMNLANAFRSFN